MLLLKPESAGKPLAGRLEVVKLETCEPWEAVSYAWGTSSHQSSIEIDGKMLRITSNLEDALLDLRYKKRESRLWVDQICVDQNNTDERSKQVQSMHEIYRRASMVLVYLGPDLGKVARKAFFAVKLLRNLDEDGVDLLRHGGFPEVTPCLEYLRDLFEAPWVRRPYNS
jgi:hypothetical protein